MSFKKIIGWIHLWLGLASGLVVFILSVTGCFLVFETELKGLIHPWWNVEQPEGGQLLPPSSLYATVAQTLPGKDIRSVWYHGTERSAHVSINDSDSLAYVNPYTGELMALVDEHEDLFHFMEDGHFYLWLPPAIGSPVVGWSTFIFFILLISGIILWWPAKWNKAGLRKSFRIKLNARFKRLNYDLHNVLGFYSLLIAFVFAFTGLIMSFTWFSKGVAWLAGGKPFRYEQSVSDTTLHKQVKDHSQVDKAWEMGMNRIGEHRTREIIVSFPKEASDPIYLCTDMYQGTWRDVYLDQHTLEELPGTQPRLREADFATWLRRSNYGLHVGETGGLLTKILYFVASLICASLPVTGFFVWWNRR